MKLLSVIVSILCFFSFFVKGVCAHGGNARCPFSALAANGLVQMTLHVFVPQAALWNGSVLNVAGAPHSNDTDIFVLMMMLLLLISCAIRFCPNMDDDHERSGSLIMGIMAEHILCHVVAHESDLFSSFMIHVNAWRSLLDCGLSIETWNAIADALLSNGSVGLAQIRDLRACVLKGLWLIDLILPFRTQLVGHLVILWCLSSRRTMKRTLITEATLAVMTRMMKRWLMLLTTILLFEQGQ